MSPSLAIPGPILSQAVKRLDETRVLYRDFYGRVVSYCPAPLLSVGRCRGGKHCGHDRATAIPSSSL